MNERIRELAEQADGVVINKMMTGAKQYTFLEEDLKKFALLIVRECIDIVSPYAIRMENFDGGHPITDLKKHFGVEEPKGYQPTGWVCPKCGTDRTKAACPRGRGAATDGSCPMFGVAQ